MGLGKRRGLNELRRRRQPRTLALVSGHDEASANPTIRNRCRALGNVARLVVAAERHGQKTVDLDELRVALAEVDVAGLANPRPCVVRNVGGSFDLSELSLRTSAQA